MRMHPFNLIVVACLISTQHCVSAQTPDRVLTIPTPDGGEQRALYVSPLHPRGIIVMLPGGAGDIGIGADSGIAHGDNFVVRSRALWVAAGFAVLIPDTVDDRNLRGLRSSSGYAAVVGALVTAARAQASAPVFLFGTSQGAVAAMNGAAHLRHREIAGVVLSEAVSVKGGSHETVFDAHPGEVNVPALVVANSDDRCDVAPPQNADSIAAAMTQSPALRVLRVSGGEQRSSRNCGSLSPHGYYGIEGLVVDAVVAWMKPLM
jgi:hypothetical protein